MNDDGTDTLHSAIRIPQSAPPFQNFWIRHGRCCFAGRRNADGVRHSALRTLPPGRPAAVRNFRLPPRPQRRLQAMDSATNGSTQLGPLRRHSCHWRSDRHHRNVHAANHHVSQPSEMVVQGILCQGLFLKAEYSSRSVYSEAISRVKSRRVGRYSL